MDLNYKVLKDAVSAGAAAIRCRVRLQPAGGVGSKVFPPTHSGGVYAWERRRIGDDEVLPTVLLDSVQSQANRLEQALLAAHQGGRLQLPLLAVDFSDAFPDIGAITTLDAPHRIADAIFRDSLLDGEKFRESSIGKAFSAANVRDATALFQYCPHALLFGVWDSTGSAGGLGNKFQRAIVSEIVGINAERGVLTSSRLDPLGIKSVEIYEAPNGEWTTDVNQALTNKKGEPVKAKPSDFNHSNIPPTIDEDDRSGEVLRGGVTLSHALQTTVLSLPALRRLRFPLGGDASPERDVAAWLVLAALGLAAVTHLRDQGYDLRSRCLLIPEGPARFELVANDGGVQDFTLDSAQADAIYAQAVEAAKQAGLPWLEQTLVLQPEERLVELVRKSRESAPEEE